MMRFCNVAYIWVLLTLCVTSCRPEGEIVRSDKNTFSAADQAKIGETLTSHILNTPALFDLYRTSSYPEVYSYLNDRMLNSVVKTPTVQNRSIFNWNIYVVRDDENKTTFTLPGGKIFITSGFLKFITSESQLLALISHEVNYTDEGIVMDLLVDNYEGLILGDLIYNNPVEEIGAMIETLQQEPLLVEQVKEADRYAVEILCPFSYSPMGIASIIENVGDQDFPLQWTQIRPPYADRTAIIEGNTVELDCGEKASIEETEAEEKRYKELFLKYLD